MAMPGRYEFRADVEGLAVGSAPFTVQVGPKGTPIRESGGLG